MEIRLIEDELDKARIVEKIIRQLPKWFDDNAIRDYPEKVKNQRFYVAIKNDMEIGFLSIKLNYEYTAEIYALGVLEKYHKQGIGKQLLKEAEKDLCESYFKYLMVKTLSESAYYEPYERTREFYKKVGFYSLDEVKEIWGKENPCLIMIKNIISK